MPMRAPFCNSIYLFAIVTLQANTPLHERIDGLIREKAGGHSFSGVCDDATFLRRVSLDITGTLPEPDEVEKFLNQKDPAKRGQLVDRLLKTREYSEFWALKWADLLRVEEKTLDRNGVEKFYGWLRDSLDSGMGLDQLAREILSATGSTYSNPPANYYRALRRPDERAEATAQVFLGSSTTAMHTSKQVFILSRGYSILGSVSPRIFIILLADIQIEKIRLWLCLELFETKCSSFEVC